MEDFMGRLPCTIKEGILLKKDLSEISKEFKNPKKGDMSVSEYTAGFTKKMKLVSRLIPTEHSNGEKFANGVPTNIGPIVK